MADNSWREFISKTFIGLLDLFFPVTCLFCLNPVDRKSCSPVPLCASCAGKLPVLSPPICRLCGLPLDRPRTEPFEEYEPDADSGDLPLDAPLCGQCRTRNIQFEYLLSGFAYQDKLRSIVQDWKFGRNSLWGNWLGDRLAEVVKEKFEGSGWDFLVPIPLHRLRLEKRGFNQAGQLSKTLAERFDIPQLNVLEKVRRTRAQSELARSKRLDNLKDCFRVKKIHESEIKKKNLLLVDDIYTTGSTLKSAADKLFDAGAGKLGAVVLARTLPDYR